MLKRSRIISETEVKVFSFSGARGTVVCCKAREEKEETCPTILKKHESSIVTRPKETLQKKRKFILTYFIDRILNSVILDLILSLQRR